MRYLFGPVDRNFAEQNLAEEREAGRCLAFDAAGTADVRFGPEDRWEDFVGRLPAGWRPDCVVLHAQYQVVPPGLWDAPIPIVGLAGDWNLLWHGYRRILRRCDATAADAPGVERFRREGFPCVLPAMLYGAERRHYVRDANESARDIDVLFVGNFNPAIHGERLRKLRQVADAAPDRNIVFATNVHGDDYVRLLRRARIAFNRSVRGEWNLRCSEALAAGALLFLESSNWEAATLLKPGEDYVEYDDSNLSSLLRHFLDHEKKRKLIADRGFARASQCSFAALWSRTAVEIEKRMAEWNPADRQRPEDDLADRTWGRISAVGSDPLLHQEIAAGLRAHPRSSRFWHLHATLLAWERRRTEDDAAVAGAYQNAWLSDPRNAVAGTALAETLFRMNLRAEANEQAERTLAMLDRADPDTWSLPPFPTRFDRFRCEWERAAWENAGNFADEHAAKQRLVRWRLQHLLGDCKNDVTRRYAAVLERPDLPETRLALGEALLASGKSDEACEHLEAAWEANPFHAAAAHATYLAWTQLGRTDRHVALARSWRNLAKAAPGFAARESSAQNADIAKTPARPAEMPRFSIAWEGDFDGVASLANVNRNLRTILEKRGHAVHPFSLRDPSESPATIDVHIAHQWPPRFAPPPAGLWVLMQPWEFGSIPKAWVEPIRRDVSEVWVPSRFVRNGFLNAGISPEKVHVVPNGFSPTILGDRAKPFPLRSRKRFKFLFVGGAIHRKGIDLLLTAYGQCFDASDDVCLVVKSMGKQTFYRGQTADKIIEDLCSRPDAPEVEHLEEDLSESEMASLYAACDCLVHPFRGEGFGMPILEAMANGLPAIVTGFGPVLDFCTDETAYLLPAKAYHLPERRIGEIETVDLPYLAQPDMEMLRTAMKHVASSPPLAAVKGEAARRLVASHCTWEHAADAVEARLGALWGREKAVPNIETTMGSGSVSLCMIVKNEEQNLKACLDSVKDLVDEIVVVDTGSTDGTRDIAVRYGARVFEFPWIDDFASARNETLRHARGGWIFWMDADDRVDAENRERLKAMLKRLDDQMFGYVMKCRCLPDQETGTVTVVDHVRLFRRHPEVRWKYRIHEQILPSIRRLGKDVAWTDVVIDHTGYQDPALRGRKLQRDARLLELEDRDRPDDPFTLFNLGSVRQEMGQIVEALVAFRRSLTGSSPGDSIVRKLYALIAQCERHLDRFGASLDACVEGRSYYPDDPEILFQEGLTRRALGDLRGAEACYLAAMAPASGKHFSSIDLGVRGYKARHNLAVLCREQHRFADAESHWRAALQESPAFLPAWLGLTNLLLQSDRLDEALVAAESMESIAGIRSEGQMLRAAVALRRRRFREAIELLRALARKEPGALPPRILLSQALLQEGADPTGAEDALLDVLRIDPVNVEARSNLEILRSQKPQASSRSREASWKTEN